MVLRFLAGAVVAALALACFGLTPAQAHSSRKHLAYDCCKKKIKKQRAQARCGKYCAIHQALAAKTISRDHKGKWHGWVITRKGFAFYLDGARYKGGTPFGPAFAYNNWERGFNRRVFWLLTDRDRY